MALDPLHDRRMRHRTLPPVIISGLDSLTPAHTEDDDLSSNGGLWKDHQCSTSRL